MTLAKWHIDPGDLAIWWPIEPGDSHERTRACCCALTTVRWRTTSLGDSSHDRCCFDRREALNRSSNPRPARLGRTLPQNIGS